MDHSGLGADDEARTRYLHLGKVALYQMSYVRIRFYALCQATCVIIANRFLFVKGMTEKIFVCKSFT